MRSIALARFEGLSLIAQFNFQRASGFYRPNSITQGTKIPRASLLFATGFSVAQKRGDFIVSAGAVKTFLEVFFFFFSPDVAINRNSFDNLQIHLSECKRFFKKFCSPRLHGFYSRHVIKQQHFISHCILNRYENKTPRFSGEPSSLLFPFKSPFPAFIRVFFAE
ncbi:MAG TPA: hypothetical protein P5186_21635 [Candidatus Paceibacterota bacterium]|nr:hypothetical protein [Candidatus Paceibacterota bacterium]